MNMTPLRFLSNLRCTSYFLLFVNFTLSFLYLIFLRYSIPLIFYVDSYHDIAQVSGYGLSAIYILTLATWLLGKPSQGPVVRKVNTFLLFTTLLCCFGGNFALRLPRTLDTATLQNETYYLTGEIEAFDSHTFHRLYKCSNTRIECERTSFFEGGGASFVPLYLQVNDADEIDVLYKSMGGFDFLEYTFGTPSRYYEYPAQLNDRLYYLSYYSNPESSSNIHILYECKLNNTSCKQLPFRYTGVGYGREVRANEETGEINVIIDNESDMDILIFTWGENPSCHVNGCETMEDQ